MGTAQQKISVDEQVFVKFWQVPDRTSYNQLKPKNNNLLHNWNLLLGANYTKGSLDQMLAR